MKYEKKHSISFVSRTSGKTSKQKYCRKCCCNQGYRRMGNCYIWTCIISFVDKRNEDDTYVMTGDRVLRGKGQERTAF
jgi:hypothetical protein